jgi:hypothetical protein
MSACDATPIRENRANCEVMPARNFPSGDHVAK